MNIHKSVIQFLKDLQQNNNRDWFNANKDAYQEAHEHMIAFADDLLIRMNKHDQIETPTGKKSLQRIYRDTRFSKDKTPYKGHFGGGFSRATKQLRGGYYFHIEPGQFFIGGGFWGPNSGDLKLIREHIAQDDKPLRKALASKKFTAYYDELKGEQVKTAPKGFDKEHPAIDLLRYKQFLVSHKFTQKQALSADFSEEVSKAFAAMRPFFDCMSEFLTTDLNGESIV